MELDLTIKRPALRWHGSKFRLAPWIVSHFPPHTCYVEPYGGGAGVLLRKPRVNTEIYNDLDGDAVNFFRILRDPALLRRLCAMLQLTPFSREEYKTCYAPHTDPVERARRMVARCYMGFGSHSHNIDNSVNGFRTLHHDGRTFRHSYARELLGIPDNLMVIAERFAGVVIEQVDALDCIERYDLPDTLMYCDPPYVPCSRRSGGHGYAFEMDDLGHRRLAWMLHKVKAKVIISGYDTPLYRELFADWRREEKKTMANGQWGATPRTEVLWLNFAS